MSQRLLRGDKRKSWYDYGRLIKARVDGDFTLTSLRMGSVFLSGLVENCMIS